MSDLDHITQIKSRDFIEDDSKKCLFIKILAFETDTDPRELKSQYVELYKRPNRKDPLAVVVST